MMYFKPALLSLICIIWLGCHNQKPYENNRGIDPLLIAQIDTAHYTLIEWNDSIIDFGSIKAGDSIQIRFVFKNIGSTPLFILKARASCWCVELNFPKDPVMPGKSAFILATIKNKAYKGYFRKTIAVTTNTKFRQSYILIIQGKILN